MAIVGGFERQDWDALPGRPADGSLATPLSVSLPLSMTKSVSYLHRPWMGNQDL